MSKIINKKTVKEHIDKQFHQTEYKIDDLENKIDKINIESPETILSEGLQSIPEKDKKGIEFIKNNIEPTLSMLSLTDDTIKIDELYKYLYYKHYKNNIKINDKLLIDINIIIQNIINENYVYNSSKDKRIFIFTEIRKWIRNFIIPIINDLINDNLENKIENKNPINLKILDFNVNKNSPLYKKIENDVKSFYESFYSESNACLYYTYYLLKLKGIKDFDYEFRILEDKLYKDFYNYGIFAIIKELTHFIDSFTYKSNFGYENLLNHIVINSNTYKNPRIINKDKFLESINNLSVCKEIDIKLIYKIINIYQIDKYTKYHMFNGNTYKERKMSMHIGFIYLIEKYFGYYTKPENILKESIKIFDTKYSNIEYKECKWNSSYGGKSWKTISETILNRNKQSKTMFVDTCWSLQHNTQLFINKIYDIDNDINNLLDYLEQIKNGIFKNVFECAIESDSKLDRYIYHDIITKNDTNNYKKEEQEEYKEKLEKQIIINKSKEKEEKLIEIEKLISFKKDKKEIE